MGLYYEDFEIGQSFTSVSRTITESDVVQFTGLSGDFNPLHTDEEFAKNTPFETRIAHGALGFSVMTGLMDRLGIFTGTALAFLGIENWMFLKPILIGDTIHFEMKILNKRLTSTKERGIIFREVTVYNQRKETVQKGQLNIMVKCYPKNIT
ncbi:dehydratase [Pueribacillus theae]|uniref:Dehydratase n=1 Tax=Pueribacillus theae TaxID=2171751 RepID=A0A2U1K591_9BACI|nr:MaoC/PaaZ C-terminal domain-containing protein [Pueribacillus theae]PWA12163.1 dehydratase [Pueribacillus theae]